MLTFILICIRKKLKGYTLDLGKARLHQVHERLVGFMCKVNTASPNDFPLRLLSLPIYFAWKVSVSLLHWN